MLTRREKDMLKQQDMTETAAAVLHFLPADKWVTPRMMTRTTGVSEARCQLILTQLVLAGLAKDNGGYWNKFRRCQYWRFPAVKMGGWWVLVAPASHSLMLTGHKRTTAHCFSAKAE